MFTHSFLFPLALRVLYSLGFLFSLPRISKYSHCTSVDPHLRCFHYLRHLCDAFARMQKIRYRIAKQNLLISIFFNSLNTSNF